MFFCALAKKGSLALTVFPWGVFLAELSLKLLILKAAEISLRIQKVLKHTMLEVTGGKNDNIFPKLELYRNVCSMYILKDV